MIGGGIAGASVAYFAAQHGASVTVLDAGDGRASDVPAALVNPVRGQGGRVNRQMVEGMRETWALVEALEAAGFPVPHGRAGLWRPVPDEATRLKWTRQLPEGLPHRWERAEDVPGLAPGWHAALWLPEGGWLDGKALVGGLLRASGAVVLRARARSWTAGQVKLEDGEILAADVVFVCGGSRGADWAGETATHRGGSLWLTGQAPVAVPLSFGVYASPAARGGVLGATFEAPAAHFNAAPPPAASLEWLARGAERLLGAVPGDVTGLWTGSRLAGLRAGRDARGVWLLSGLGSKGFLLAPLLARHLVGDALGGGAGSRLV